MEYVSLGATCAVANHLKTIKRYPFDWCKININQLNKVLFNNFIDFNNIKYFKTSLEHKYLESNNASIIVKNKYNITFAHEIINKYNIDIFKQKLNKRINQFINLKKPYFIRFEYGKQKKNYNKEFIKLINSLDSQYDNYKLLLIIPHDWNINYNNVYFYNDKFIDWKYDNVFNKAFYNL
jgi:hypothetical protein